MLQSYYYLIRFSSLIQGLRRRKRADEEEEEEEDFKLDEKVEREILAASIKKWIFRAATTAMPMEHFPFIPHSNIHIVWLNLKAILLISSHSNKVRKL